MSEQERIEFSDKITDAINKGLKAMYERRAKLGETVVIADENGMPLVVPAKDALRFFDEPALATDKQPGQ